MTPAQIHALAAEHAARYGPDAAERLAAALPDVPWRIDPRADGGRGGTPSHRGTVTDNLRFARALFERLTTEQVAL